MPIGSSLDVAAGAQHDPALTLPPDEKHQLPATAHVTETPPVFQGEAQKNLPEYLDHDDDSEYHAPTDEELATLRRVSDKIPYSAFMVGFVELCERFSYYGTTVVFTNFIQQPLPAGSNTGAGGSDQSGALNMGQQASTGLTTFNTFWVYLVPLFAAYVADTYLGRYKTICWAIGIAIIGHIIMIMSAIPPVIVKPNSSLACFIIGLIIMGIGTGGFKPNISPLVAEQLPLTRMTVKTLPSGERVIVDPAVTSSRVYHWFYLLINIGALVGPISMAYCEYYVGYYLSFTLPTAVFLLCPFVMWYGKGKYKTSPPQGSVLGKATRIFMFANKGRWHLNPVKTYRHLHDGTFWETVRPSAIDPALRPAWMTFDDQWVDEVRRGFAACSVFCWYPLYWLTYNQMNNNMTSQAATMKLGGVPNDVISNLDPFALIILIPICDIFLYPLLRKMKINFSPIKKITLGFYTGAAAMVWTAVVQAYIYKYSDCGTHAASCDTTVSISVWAQTGGYVLIALSEIFASITSLEYAYSKAPRNMRSMVQAFALFTTAIAAAIGEAFVSLSEDPLLVWNYGVMAVLAFIGGTGFWIQFRGLDKMEDELNMLPTGHVDAAPKDIEDADSTYGRPVAGEIPLDADEKKAAA